MSDSYDIRINNLEHEVQMLRESNEIKSGMLEAQRQRLDEIEEILLKNHHILNGVHSLTRS